MKRKIKTAAVVLSISLSSLVFIFGGCTKYANVDDLAELERQKQAVNSAQERIQELESQKEDLERQIAQKEQELKEKEDTLNQIRGK